MKTTIPLVLAAALAASSVALPVDAYLSDDIFCDPHPCESKLPWNIVTNGYDTGLNKRSPAKNLADILHGDSPQDIMDRVELAYDLGRPLAAETVVEIERPAIEEAHKRVQAKFGQAIKLPEIHVFERSSGPERTVSEEANKQPDFKEELAGAEKPVGEADAVLSGYGATVQGQIEAVKLSHKAPNRWSNDGKSADGNLRATTLADEISFEAAEERVCEAKAIAGEPGAWLALTVEAAKVPLNLADGVVHDV